MIARTKSPSEFPGSASLPPGQAASQAAFDWPLANDAEAFLRSHMAGLLERNSTGRTLATRMEEQTGTDFFEWIDHFELPASAEHAVIERGFLRDDQLERPAHWLVYEYPRATLPRIVIRPFENDLVAAIAIRPESIADFNARNNVSREPEGEPFSQYRRVQVSEENATRLEAVERRAYLGFKSSPLQPGELERILKARELWHTRPRLFPSDEQGFKAAEQIQNRVLQLVGRDLACHFFFNSEREYWQRRNRAAQVQKQRQDQLGLGWGNHDHHTFRCSRQHFVDLMTFLLRFGFLKRERYYAGAEAGWGAQICEHAATGIVVFADVDLMPTETNVDFSQHRLPTASQLGTVGLWVGLHGESFLQAGMHHLEARFEFGCLRDQLQTCGIQMMKPFSDFDFLRQAFTEGERWLVQPDRAESLKAAGLISPEQCRRFVQEGALGSHLENLQRHGGFKGFNQKSVSVIIQATDPRKSVSSQPAVAA